jgi:hypothetical protein
VVLMAVDPLDQVLRLVAEGRLTADEAAPILAALDDRGPAREGGATGRFRAGSGGEPAGSTFAGAADAGTSGASGPGGASTLRIEIRDGGRSVLNLRLPIAAGRFALDRIPGLSGDQVDRVREAVGSGQRGPVIDVDEYGGSGVRILLE